LPLGDASGAEARRRQVYAVCATHPLAGRARLPALHYGTRQDFHILARLQASLPGTRFRRALPAFACPSPGKAPPAPAVVPESMMPGTARERFAKPRAGAVLAPLSKVPSRRRPRVSKVTVCNMISDECQVTCRCIGDKR
jgi:hypothetical protein